MPNKPVEETSLVEEIPHSMGTEPEEEKRPKEEKSKRRVGRPRKADLEKNKKGNRGKVGRPKGDAAILNEYKAMMLTSPKSPLIMAKILDIALNDDHQNQAAMLKLVAERLIPISAFSNDAKRGAGGVQINVSVVGDANIESNEATEPIEAEYEEL